MKKTSCLDKEEIYRYTLGRTWDCKKERLLCVMLNPSTADANVDDPTITRCRKFAVGWGYGGLVVGNLFALRSPDPRDLFQQSDPVGPDNNCHLRQLAKECKTVVAAWGASAKAFSLFREREAYVKGLFPGRMKCLETTAEGYPKHPMARGKHRVPDDAMLRPFH